jgi:DNA-binding transcriptional regulator YiaG
MLAHEITTLRKRLGWSMSRLAQHLEISANLVVDWESGQRFPTKKHHVALMALAQSETPPVFSERSESSRRG